jgi:hypothetical protein
LLYLQTFQRQQKPLDLKTAAIADELTGFSDDAMARDQNDDRVPVVGHPHGAACRRVSHSHGNVGVRPGFAERYLFERLPAGQLKRRPGRGKRQIKTLQISVEIGIKLCTTCRRSAVSPGSARGMGLKLRFVMAPPLSAIQRRPTGESYVRAYFISQLSYNEMQSLSMSFPRRREE